MAHKQADNTDHALCSGCAVDAYLKQHIQENGTLMLCSECGREKLPAITVEDLAEFVEPQLREYFEPGQDPYGTGQQGNELGYCVGEVVGQELSFEEQLVDAVVDTDDYRPDRGEEAYWDTDFNYVKKEVHFDVLHEHWRHALEELKHSRRFFSPAAKSLFEWLFEGTQGLRTSEDNQPVVYELPEGTEIFRARIAHSDEDIKAFLDAPFEKVGPPPKELARAGRMNAEGVAVLYSALDSATCLAEMRPSISNELGVIALRTTAPLRILDFSRLEKARGDSGLSYFQPDYDRALQKSHFLRMMHYLISQPIVPGHETDHLITQTMAEYLAHVYEQPFAGILFRSSQNEGGMNLVLFSDPELLVGTKEQEFRVQYQAESIKLHMVTAVAYTHHDMKVLVRHDGGIYKRSNDNHYEDDD